VYEGYIVREAKKDYIEITIRLPRGSLEKVVQEALSP